MKPCILLTGATGYVGKHILRQLLRQGYRVVVIARRKKKSPGKRVIDALKPFGAFPADSLDVIEGDIRQPDCGIDSAALEKLAGSGVVALIHSAGLTRFDAHLANEIQLNNLQGTKHVYALARGLGIESFHYLSTAYVAGDTRQVFMSTDLDAGQGFNNPYEASKFEAEKYLHDACSEDAVRVVIYRPSIVVGGYPSGENNAVSTVYSFMKAAHFIRECCRRDLQRGRGVFTRCGVRQHGDTLFIPLRIAADPQVSINLVSVDQVVDGLVRRLETGDEKHTVIPLLGDDFSLNNLRDVICDALEIKGVSFVNSKVFEQRSRTVVEENFYRATLSYRPYLFSAPVFPEDEKDRGSIDIEKTAVEFNELMNLKMLEKRRMSLNGLALNTFGVTGPQDYFHLFVNGRLGKSFLKRIAYVSTKIRFLIRGDQVFDQVIYFDRGSIHYDSEADFDCSFEMDQPLFNDIVNGKTDLKSAFFEGKVRIEGDRETALKFGFLFSEYFLHIDERVMEEMLG